MPALTTGAVIVFALVGVALTLFVTELLPPDVTAIGVLVSLAVLAPHTGVPAREAIAGFASPAVVTIIAMYVLSAGVEEAGVVEWLGAKLAAATGGDEGKLLGATVGTTGLSAGFVNNTPIVAVFVPLVTGIAERYGISPSKLLMPLSFAAMLGGTLTLVGTSTNLLASEYARELLDHPLGMFEFTPVGLVIFVAGAAYLLTLGRRLVPARIESAVDATETHDLDRHLAQLVVRPDSPLVGHTVTDALDASGAGPVLDDTDPTRTDGGERSTGRDAVEPEAVESPPARSSSLAEAAAAIDVDVLQFDRDGESYFAPGSDVAMGDGDVLTVRGNRQAVNQFAETFGLRHLTRADVTEDDLSAADHEGLIAEAVVPPGGRLVGRTLAALRLRERFDTTVLSVRRGERYHREDLSAVELAAGDTILLQTTPTSIEYLRETGDLIVTDGPVPGSDADEADAPALGVDAYVALATLLGVVGLAGLNLVPIYIAALGGVVAMVAAGVLSASGAYDAVGWNVVFLLAGLLPLGAAMQATGGAAVIGSALFQAGAVVPPVVLLGAFYGLTTLLASVITPVATVVLMTPIAVDTAARLDVAGLPFLLVVMFAASTAFLTPIGYQTNLMVYGAGGHRFTDFARVGAPLQLLLLVVTTVAVATYWPL